MDRSSSLAVDHNWLYCLKIESFDNNDNSQFSNYSHTPILYIFSIYYSESISSDYYK